MHCKYKLPWVSHKCGNKHIIVCCKLNVGFCRKLKKRIVVKRPPFALFMQEIIQCFDEAMLKVQRLNAGYKVTHRKKLTEDNLRYHMVTFAMYKDLPYEEYTRRQMRTLGGLTDNVSNIGLCKAFLCLFPKVF